MDGEGGETEREQEREESGGFCFFRFIRELSANLLQCWIGAIILWQLSLNRKVPRVIVSKALRKAALCVFFVCVWGRYGLGGGGTEDVPMWLLARDRPRVGTLHTPHPHLLPLPQNRLIHIGHMHAHACTRGSCVHVSPPPTPPPLFPKHTHIWVLPGYQRLTYLFRKDLPCPTLVSCAGIRPKPLCPPLQPPHCRRHAKHWTCLQYSK